MAGLKCARAGLVALCVFLCGCPAGVDLDGGGSIFGSANDAVGDAPASDDQQTAVDATVAGQSSSQLRGEVSEYGDYRLFDVGGASAGEQISVAVNDPFSTISPFLVAIFDEAGDLVMRGVVAAGQPVTHAVRASAANFTVGVTPLSNSTGGAF
ncbi:MAG: hypothetical protein JNG88_18700, partial [Phycisphaerales bacterium]|nr:hypothetical protein [Phycisphaerales bacterium]